MFDNPALPPALMAQNPFEIFKKKPHDSHPSLPHLVLLVFEAVMEVVCVALPGYIIARLGHFDAEKQKFLANLNIQLFTPCLIFTKLASQLNADKLVDLGIIPVIFVIMTFVSYMVGLGVTKAFGLGRRPANFVIAMGVRTCVNLGFMGRSSVALTPPSPTGFWQLKLPPHLSRYLTVANDLGPTLG